MPQTEKSRSIGLNLNVFTSEYYPQTRTLGTIFTQLYMCHKKVLLNGFQFNGLSLAFRPQKIEMEPPINNATEKYCSMQYSFHLKAPL